jgi:hypothetical protein
VPENILHEVLAIARGRGYDRFVPSRKYENTKLNARTGAVKIDADLHQRVAVAVRLKNPPQTITAFVENALRMALGPKRAA